MDIDVRFENGTPKVARVHFDNIDGTARFEIADSTATLADIEVPTREAGDSINLVELNALNSNIENAKSALTGLSFIDSVQ